VPVPVGEGVMKMTAPDTGGIEFSMPEPDEDILDITSIGITLPVAPIRGKWSSSTSTSNPANVEPDYFKKDKDLIDELKSGDSLDDIQFYSPIAMFKGTAVVTNKTPIDTGPKQGDFCLDLKITST
jgi:hypothetical protein